MNKLLIVFCVFVLLLQGCAAKGNENNAVPIINEDFNNSNSTKENVEILSENIREEVSEPLSKAIEKIEEGDYDFALKYLELTVQDFSDSTYIYDAHILKSLIYDSYYRIALIMGKDLFLGIQKGISLVSKEDNDMISGIYDSLIDKAESNKESYYKSIEFVLNEYKNYPNRKLVEINASNIGQSSDNNFFNYNYFIENGYPLPTESEIEQVAKVLPIVWVEGNLENILVDGEINVSEVLFLYLSSIDDKNLSIKICEEILELEKDNKYSEIKLIVEEYLETIK